MSPPLSPQLTASQTDWLRSCPVLPETLVLKKRSGGVVPLKILDRDPEGVVRGIRMGMKGFVFRVEDPDDGSVYAAKLCVREDYDADRTEQTEARLAAVLRRAEGLFGTPVHTGRVDRFAGMPGPQDEFVCFVSEWVDGHTLEEWCSAHRSSITGEFIVGVARQIYTAVTYLSRNSLKHDDMHWGNVMVRPPNPDLVMTKADANAYRVCIIDLGSLKPADQPTRKSRDDHLCLVEILHALHNAAWHERSLVAAAPRFFVEFRAFLAALLDEDPSRHFPSSDLFMAALDQVEVASRSDAPLSLKRHFNPFEGISAEHLADDETLLELFSTLPWFPSVQETKPVVLTGPRGCGKSMLFRYLSAPTQAKAIANGTAGETRGFGVYVSCATHLQNNLVWIARTPGRAREQALSISTYFQLVVARELLRAVDAVYRDPVARQRFDLRANVLGQWIQWIDHQFIESIETPRMPSESRVLHFAEDLDRASVQVHKAMLHRQESSILLSDGFLGKVTEKLAQLNPAFLANPIVFLLDDYTENRLHKDIQATLNRIVFERRSSHYFKISCERMGFDAIDSEGVKIDRAREYDEMDAGQYAVEDCPIGQAEEFLRALIDKRLKKAGWLGTCELLIGSSEPFAKDIDLARFIRETGSTQGRRYFYYGMTHLARLWSGDIATTLQVVKDMCIQDGVKPETTTRISAATQHKSIVAIAKAYRNRVKDLHPLGTQLASVLEAFGEFARTVLVNGQLNNKNQPRRVYRIEMTLASNEDLITQLHLRNPEAASVARELLRRSIFHPLRPSRGKEGAATSTVRWEIRNIYRPALGLSLEKSESYLDVKEIGEFERLLLEPAQYLGARAVAYALGRHQDRQTGSLFAGDDDER